MTQASEPISGQNWEDPVLGIPFIWIESLGTWVARYVVSNEQFRRFRTGHDSGSFEGYSLNDDRQPAVMVSFHDAMKFCDWFRIQLLDAGVGATLILRLPSHNDWTAIAACGRAKRYPWGDDWPPTYGNYGDEAGKRAFPEWDVIEGYDDGYPVSCPVTEAGENEWGLVGVAGNVYEWTFVAGGTGTELRGGSWCTYQKPYLELKNRLRREASSKLVNFGFRLVLAR